MEFIIDTNRKPTDIEVVLEAQMPAVVRLVAFDPLKPRTFYMNRTHELHGRATFHIPMPVSPKKLKIVIYNELVGNTANERTIKVINIKKTKLPVWNIDKSLKDRRFLKWAKQFSENAGVLSPGLYKDSGFTFRYVPVIISKKTGKPMVGNPASIGAETGIFTISKTDFDKYTVPMRMAILCHEYAHYFKNKKPENEFEADLRGMYLYLGEGFPRVEALRAWIAVFSQADNESNDKRYQLMRKFIGDFESGKIAKKAA